MTTDDLEFQISQYVDGTLSDAERAEVEALLEQDAAAREMLVEHRRVTENLRANRLSPAIDLDALARRVAGVIDAEEARRDGAYSLRWVRRFVPVALAASVLIGFALMSRTGAPKSPVDPMIGPVVNSVAPAPPGVMEVTGPQIPKPDGGAVANITVGPAPGTDPAHPAGVAQETPGTGPRVIYLGQSRPATPDQSTTQPSDKPLY